MKNRQGVLAEIILKRRANRALTYFIQKLKKPDRSLLTPTEGRRHIDRFQADLSFDQLHGLDSKQMI